MPELVRDALLALAVPIHQVECADDDSASETSRARDGAHEEAGGCAEEGAEPERPGRAAVPHRVGNGVALHGETTAPVVVGRDEGLWHGGREVEEEGRARIPVPRGPRRRRPPRRGPRHLHHPGRVALP